MKESISLLKIQNFIITMSRNLSIIIQGPIVTKTTKRGFATSEVIMNARSLYPQAQIIYSGWKDGKLPDSLEKLLDKSIYSNLVEQNSIYQNGSCLRKENTNRQIVSTLNGLYSVTNDYVLKIRSDCKPVKTCNFNNIYKKNLISNFDVKKIILATKNYTRIFFVHDGEVSYAPFHVSDLVHFGAREPMLKYWSAGLLKDSDFNYNSSIYTAEQMLFNRFINNEMYTINASPYIKYKNEIRYKIIENLSLIEKYFFFLNTEDLGILLPRRFVGKWFERHLFITSFDIKIIVNGGIKKYLIKASILAYLYQVKLIIKTCIFNLKK